MLRRQILLLRVAEGKLEYFLTSFHVKQSPCHILWPQFRFYTRVNYFAQHILKSSLWANSLRENVLALHICLLLVPFYFFVKPNSGSIIMCFFDSDQCEHKTWEWS